MIDRYVVRLAEYGNCWLADWGGDPGRTLVENSAKLWSTKRAAERAAKVAKKLYPWRMIGVVERVAVTIKTIRTEGAQP